jgi:hypothetical protein
MTMNDEPWVMANALCGVLWGLYFIWGAEWDKGDMLGCCMQLYVELCGAYGWLRGAKC